MNAIRMARGFIGVILVIAGVGLGVWAGVWWALIGGIVQAVEGVKATPVDAWQLAFGLARPNGERLRPPRAIPNGKGHSDEEKANTEQPRDSGCHPFTLHDVVFTGLLAFLSGLSLGAFLAIALIVRQRGIK